MRRIVLFAALIGLLPAAAAKGATYRMPTHRTLPAIDWHSDYAEAMAMAQADGKLLFLHFYSNRQSSIGQVFESSSLSDPRAVGLLSYYVAARLPTDASIMLKGRRTRLLDHPAFQEMQGQEGIAILDFANRETPYYGRVVTAIPFQEGRFYRYRPEHLAVALNLPAGTLTQRTLVFAVRIHPEGPASTRGELDPVLAEEAQRHSSHQARIRRQGHHNWEGRFPRLSRLLPLGLRAQEIVAESWPHQNLVDAAVDCVDSWRHSSGHWSAVRAQQPRFAYDMQQGSNGVWYATGLFGNNR